MWWVDCFISVIEHMQRSLPSPRIHTEKTAMRKHNLNTQFPIPFRGNRQTCDNWEQVSKVPPVAWNKCVQLSMHKLFSALSSWNAHLMKQQGRSERVAVMIGHRDPRSVICCRQQRAADLEHAQLGIHKMNVRMTSPCRAALSTS